MKHTSKDSLVSSEYPDFEPNINRLVSWAWGVIHTSGLYYLDKVDLKTGELLKRYALRSLNNNKTENQSVESGRGNLGRQYQGTLWEMLIMQEKES